MSDTEKALREVSGSIEDELSTILPGSDPLGGLHVEHEGGLDYTVLSSRNGAPTVHWVTLGPDPTCTCEDYQFNRDNREPCAHIVKAVFADRMDPEQMAMSELISVTATVSQASREAERAARDAQDVSNELERNLVELRDIQADTNTPDMTTQENSSSQAANQGDSSSSGSENLDEKREALQTAFDNVVEGFEVESNEGVLWVNKTPSAPDTLPGPGNVDIFQTFLQNPDQLEYVHDNHDYKGAEPGQYFTNMIRPENVSEYIEEVLE